jgi:hypothetical protein
MLEAFVKVKLSRWFLDVRSICKGKPLEVVPRC